EDGIRDKLVTGVQTCALPILPGSLVVKNGSNKRAATSADIPTPVSETSITTYCWTDPSAALPTRAGSVEFHVRIAITAPRAAIEIGRASCRERVGLSGGGVDL